MAIEQSYNFRRVSDQVSTSGVVPAPVLEALKSEGYEAVINLMPDDSQYAVPGEADIVTSQGLEYCYIPVDFTRPTVNDFTQFASALDGLGDRRVHIHCAANFRVSAFYSRYAVRAGLWTRADAEAFVGDLWKPAEHEGWQPLLEQLDGTD